MSDNGKRGTVLVIGGGISGITAAIEASEAGCEVILVEKNPYLGGRVIRMNQYFPKLCPPTCGLEINFRRIRTSPHIRTLTLSEVDEISGGPGHYRARIRRDPRFVNSRCTACGECVDPCPVERPDAFNYGMGTTKAIYLPHEMAHPMQYVIDGEACKAGDCNSECVDACPYDAIELGMPAETLEVEVQAVIWATGWEPYDASEIENLSFDEHENVITNVMMERLASRGGPTDGKILRPSDGKEIESVAFVQCAGSRDENYLEHCSGVCCLGSLKQTRYVREQYPEAQIYVFYIDVRAPGRLEDFFVKVQDDDKVELIKGKVAKITEEADGGMVVEAEDTLSGETVSQKVDLVVLATGIVPADAGTRVEIDGGLQRDKHGFLTNDQPLPGMFGAGCAKRPVEVSACVRDATGTALKALQSCVEQAGG